MDEMPRVEIGHYILATSTCVLIKNLCKNKNMQN